jgi:hypothetical protein
VLSIILLFDYFHEFTPSLFYILRVVYMNLGTGRGKEARDAARASLGQPAWTVGKDQSVSKIRGEKCVPSSVFFYPLTVSSRSIIRSLIIFCCSLTVLPSLLLDFPNITGPRSLSNSSRVYRNCNSRRDARVQGQRS